MYGTPSDFSNSTSNTFRGHSKADVKDRIGYPGKLIPIRHNKLQFDSRFNFDELCMTMKIPSAFKICIEDRPFTKLLFRSTTKEIIFVCDWMPVLFGIDEDEIPESDDEEMFEVDMEELKNQALNLSPSELDVLRKYIKREDKTDEEIRETWIEYNVPRYARKVRRKFPLERDGHKEFECICDVDLFYCRHHIPRFSEGVKHGQELKIPHFKAYWEEQRDKIQMGDMERWSTIIEKQKPETHTPRDNPFRSYFNKSYTSRDVSQLRKKLLASFLPLNCREVRRHRMPFAEALYLELQEDGFQESALFFKYLLIKDYFMQESPDSLNLRQSKGKLLKLVSFLKLAERYSRTEEYYKEATILLRTAKYFNDHVEPYWWLAEEFYAKAVKTSQKSTIDGGKFEAISRFMLGLYLLDCAHKPELAQEHLSKAIELCKGNDWSAEKFLHRKQVSLYQESVNCLCRVLILRSADLRKMGKPDEALPLIHRAYKLCQESKAERDIEMETYFELGMTYEEVGFLNWAKVAFRKFIEIAEEKNYTRRVCDGYLEMAICHRREGDMERCLQNLRGFYHKAEAKGDENLVAFGQRYLGEFHLQNGNSAEAVECFKKAFHSFHMQSEKAKKIPMSEWKNEHLRLISDMKLCRVLQGLAQGELLTKPICRLILLANYPNKQGYMTQLLLWKNRGEITFDLRDPDEEEEEEIGMPEFVDIGQELSKEAEEEEAETDINRTVRFAVRDEERQSIVRE